MELAKIKLDAENSSQATAASQSTPAQPQAPTTDIPVAPLPEAPVSITLQSMIHGQEGMVTLRETDFTRVKTQDR